MKNIKEMIKEAAQEANSSEYFEIATEEFVENLLNSVYHREIEDVYISKTWDSNNSINAVTVIFNGKQTGMMIINLDWPNNVRFIELNNLQWED